MVMKKLLERELNWKNWIKSSCPPFEKFPLKKNEEMTSSDDPLPKGSKKIISQTILDIPEPFLFLKSCILIHMFFCLFMFSSSVNCSPSFRSHSLSISPFFPHSLALDSFFDCSTYGWHISTAIPIILSYPHFALLHFLQSWW